MAKENQPPILPPIGDKTVTIDETLTFTIPEATDPDGDTLSYFAYNLPEGASFDPNTRTFSWTPTSTQTGIYPNIHFEVTDGLSQPELIDVGKSISNIDTNAPNFSYITYGHVSSRYLNWAEIEPEEGVFDFSQARAKIKKWTNIGFKVDLNLPLSRQQEGYEEMIPSWLIPKIRTVVLNDGTIAPVFWDPVFWSYREKMLERVAEEFADDPNVEYIGFGEIIVDGYGAEQNRVIWHTAAQESLPEGETLTDEKFIEIYMSHLKNIVDMAEKYFPDKTTRLGLNFLRHGDQQFKGVNPDDINKLGPLKEHPEDVQAMWELADYMTQKGLMLFYPGLRTFDCTTGVDCTAPPAWREGDHLFPIFSRYSGHTKIAMRADFPDRKGWDMMDRMQQAFNFKDPATGRIYPVKVNYLELFSNDWLNNKDENGNFYDWSPAFEYATTELKKHTGASDYEDITINVFPPDTTLPGDLNADGKVNITDIQLCVKVILGTETTPAIVQRAKEVAAPLDKADIKDIQEIVRIILGG